MAATSSTISAACYQPNANSGSGAGGGVSSLWEQLCKKFPDIRNAAQYYAHDLKKMSSEAYKQYSGAALPPSSSEEGGGDLPLTGGDTEVHYHGGSPMPGVTVRTTKLTQVSSSSFSSIHGVATNDTILLLTLCVDTGFGIFEVDHEGVFEVYADLRWQEGTIVSVEPLSRHRYMVVTSDSLFDVTVGEKSSRHSSSEGTTGETGGNTRNEKSIKCVAKGAYNDAVLMPGGPPKYLILMQDFAQLTILELEHFTEVHTLCAERSILATSPRWLAYAGANDDGANMTSLSVKRIQTTLETVSQCVVSGLQALRGVWSTSPSLPASSPLGTISIYDVELKMHIASFAAHEHPLQCMKFDRAGIFLATASTAGTNVNIYQVMLNREKSRCEVTLMFRLNRGVTSNTITDISLSTCCSVLAVGTSIGTCHFFHTTRSQQSSFGRDASDFVADTLTSSTRARSAPSSTPVEPKLSILPYALHFGSANNTTATSSTPTPLDPEGIECAVCSAHGSVTFLSNTSSAILRVYTRHLHEFSGPRDPNNSFSSSGKRNTGPTSSICTAQTSSYGHAELLSHPPPMSMENFILLSADGQGNIVEEEGRKRNEGPYQAEVVAKELGRKEKGKKIK